MSDLYVKAIVNDPDVEEITIIAKLRDGKDAKGLSTLTVERATLKHLADSIPLLFDYQSQGSKF